MTNHKHSMDDGGKEVDRAWEIGAPAPSTLDAVARRETQATRWVCEKCDGSAIVRYPADATVYGVVEQIRYSHGIVSPDCGTDLTAIRVVEVPND